MNVDDPLAPLIASLARRAPLSGLMRSSLRSLGYRVGDFGANQDIVRAGASPEESGVVISGFAARVQYLPNGSRQIDTIHLPGDFVDLHSLHLVEMDHSVSAIGPCKICFIPHRDLMFAMYQAPELAWLLWQITVTDAAIARTWITCLGRRSAEQNLAHLICELYVRLDRAGYVIDGEFHFPATQQDLADILGLSQVHVNRTLGELRKKGILRWQSSRVQVPEFDRLAALAAFDDTYLLPGRAMPSAAYRLHMG